MDTLKYEALLASIEGGSFSAAAKQLGYTPSGITRMVDALEAETGFAIVRRSRTGITLTKNGERLLPSIHEIVRLSKQVSQIASEINGIITGDVTIGTYYSIAAHWLPDVIRAFQDEHPGVHINMREAGNKDLIESLRSHRFDCAILGKREFEGDWIPLASSQQVIWIPSDWPQAQLEAFPLQDLDGLPFIMPLPGSDNDIELILAQHGIRPDVRFTVNDGYTAWRMVAAGLGASMNDELMASEWEHVNGAQSEQTLREAARNTLPASPRKHVCVMKLDPPQPIEIGIAIPSMADASPAVRKFIEYVRRITPGDAA